MVEKASADGRARQIVHCGRPYGTGPNWSDGAGHPVYRLMAPSALFLACQDRPVLEHVDSAQKLPLDSVLNRPIIVLNRISKSR